MSKYLIGLDDGHGMETAGKRTAPLKENIKFRGKTFKKGSIIHENDFNENLMELVEKGLDRCGIGHVQLAPGDTDVSLANRVKTANAKKVDLVVSFHANALDSQWQTKAYGLVVIHHVNCSSKAKTLAKNCYNHLSKEVKWYSNGATKYGVRADTDISGFSLYILKNTNAPAVLIEYGFMDNWEDVKMMCSDKFQKDCAEATVKGICETLGVTYKAPSTSGTSSNNTSTQTTGTTYYRVIAGSFSKKSNADSLVAELKKKGYSPFIANYNSLYRVVVASYSKKSNAEAMVKELKSKGYSPFIDIYKK